MLVIRLFFAAVAVCSTASASPVLESIPRNSRFVARQSAPYHENARFPVRAANATGGNQTVTVKDGDTLGKLAKQFGVGLCDIAKASNLADPNIITPGQTLTIPPPAAKKDETSCLPPAGSGGGAATARCVPGGPDRLVIPSAGLTGELAAKFLNITIDSFAATNKAAFASVAGGKNVSATQLGAANLTGGSVMQVPVCPNSQCTIGQGTVKQGDIFDKIAAAAGSTTGQILALNPGIDRLNLQIGQTFTLPSNCKNNTA